MLLEEIDVLLRGDTVRKSGRSAVVRNREVTLANDVHPNQNVRPDEAAARDPDASERNIAGEMDVYEECFLGSCAADAMNLGHADRYEPASIYHGLCNAAICCASVPNSVELSYRRSSAARRRIECLRDAALIFQYI